MLDQSGSDQLPNNKKNEIPMSFYWQAYGLSSDPFPAFSENDCYFPLPEWEHHLDLLQHLVKNENVLLAVIAAEGAGKTTFSRQIIQNFSDDYFIHQFQADSLFSTRKLVRELGTGFELKAPNNETPEEQLDAQIAEVQYKEKTCLLIIDDAHFLPLETINSLFFLLKQQSKNQMRLHIILLGDKNLQTKLNNLARYEMGNAVVHTIEIEPLGLEETRQYLIYRLNRVGLIGDIPFSQMQIEKIHANSGGIPDRINRLAQQILLDGLKKRIEAEPPSRLKAYQSKIIGGTLLVVALVAASYVLDQQGKNTDQIAKNQSPILFTSQTKTIAAPKESLQQANILPAKAMLPAIPAFPTIKQHYHVEKAAKPRTITKSDTKQDKVLTAKTVTNEKSISEAAKPSNRVAKKIHNSEPQKDKLVQLSKLETISALPQSQIYHVDVIAHPNLQQQYAKNVLDNPTTPKAIKHKIEPKKVKTKKSHKTRKKVHKRTSLKLSKGEKLLLAENSKKYTIQVIGLSYKQSMIKFIQEHHLQGKAHYVQTKLHGKPWYILVYGLYKNRAEAEKAIKTLPSVLQKYKPWPRQLKYVKVDIERG